MDFEINRNKGMPVYLQIVDWVTNNIEEARWKPHYKLPSEDELTKMFGVARGTVRQALNELSNQGLIYRLHGKGTFVASDKIENKVDGVKFLTFLEQLVEVGVHFSTSILESKIDTATQEIASYLHLAEEDNRIFKIRRLRSVDDSTIMLVENNIAYNLCPNIENNDFNNHSVYSIIESQYNTKIDWAMRWFEAQLPSSQIAEILGITEDKPVTYVEQLVYDIEGRCVDVTKVWIRSDKMKLSIVMKRD